MPEVPEFVKPSDLFKAQVAIKPTRDITGYGEGREVKFHLPRGELVFVDEDKAMEWITKGYAEGQLRKEPTEDQRKKWASEMTVIRPGAPNG